MISKVSFVIPVLNEEKTIGKCLDSLLNMDFPKNDFEIIIAHGPSKDRTDSILRRYADRHDNIKLFRNPTGNTAWGRNICVMHAKGEYVMNYSGHALAKKNLLSVLVNKIEEQPDDVAAVGCSNANAKNQSFIGDASGTVFSSFIGGKNLFVQNAEYPNECFVDHISFALYRKNIVEDVGRFDTHFWCGQDAELDYRIIHAGYKILYTPNTKVYHYKRTSCLSLFSQMHRYGVARAKMGRKSKGAVSYQHLIGSMFVIGIILSGFFFLSGIFKWQHILLLIVAYWLVASMSVSLVTHKMSYVLVGPFFSFLIHIGYGTGFIRGYLYGKIWMR